MAIRSAVTTAAILAASFAIQLGVPAHLLGQSPIMVGDLVRFTPPGEGQVMGSVVGIQGDAVRLSLVTTDGTDQSGEYPFASVVGLEKHRTAFNYKALAWTAGGFAVLGGLVMRGADDGGLILADDRSQFGVGAMLGGALGVVVGLVIAQSHPSSVWRPATIAADPPRSVRPRLDLRVSGRGALGLGVSLQVGG